MTYAVCHTCHMKHRVVPGSNEGHEFLHRHRAHRAEMLAVPMIGYTDNSSIKTALGTATTFTKTNANLATSATAGWVSNAIDNTTNLYLDAWVAIELAAVNTAPGSTSAIYLFAYSLIEGSAYASTGSGTIAGTEGTITFPDITTLPICLPLLGVVSYPVQNKAINSIAFSVARCFGGRLPNKWGIAMINHSGMTLSVTNIYYEEIYSTVA